MVIFPRISNRTKVLSRRIIFNAFYEFSGLFYAQQALKIQIATLLRSYRFSTTAKLEDIRLEFAVALKSIDGYPVQISKRKTPQDLSDHHN